MSIGNLGGLISGQVYRADDAPQYLRGHRTCLGLMLGGATIALILKYCLYRINKKRDNLTEEEYQKACQGEDLCDNVRISRWNHSFIVVVSHILFEASRF